ncbi:MAG: DUF1616 domain-containing protein [Candidatus Bathyarchaeota archaeon]|nr:DUF1616 domain-containing protein [Candidatus Bathyarchaeota archaeon]
MAKKPSKDSITEEQIIQLVKKENPENVEQLQKLAKEKLSLTDEEALKHIMQLINHEKIKLKEHSQQTPQSLKTYIRSSEAYWFWTTTSLAIATAITVFTVPEDAYPVVYIRYVLGSIFVLGLPGFTLIKALFPTKKELDTIERIALSIGLSLAIVPIVGLLLNYTPWGIRLTPVTLSLLALTITFATAAILREHQTKKNEAKQPIKF